MSELRHQVMWNRLISIVEEQALALVRTAFSTSVREAGDLSAGIYDTVSGAIVDAAVLDRTTLATGDRVIGPAVIVEDQTSTWLTGADQAVLQADGCLLITRQNADLVDAESDL